MTIILTDYQDHKKVYRLNPELFKYIIEFEEFEEYIFSKGTKILVSGLGLYLVAETYQEIVEKIIEMDIEDNLPEDV